MTPSPTLTLVEELERLAKEATPGDWEAILPGDDRGQPACTYRGLISLMSTDPAVAVVAKSGLSDPDSWQGNAALIVSLRNNLPAILSALRIADEARAAGWIVDEDGSIIRPAYDADLIAATAWMQGRVEKLEAELSYADAVMTEIASIAPGEEKLAAGAIVRIAPFRSTPLRFTAPGVSAGRCAFGGAAGNRTRVRTAARPE